jgi:hypothetical protein
MREQAKIDFLYKAIQSGDYAGGGFVHQREDAEKTS